MSTLPSPPALPGRSAKTVAGFLLRFEQLHAGDLRDLMRPQDVSVPGIVCLWDGILLQQSLTLVMTRLGFALPQRPIPALPVAEVLATLRSDAVTREVYALAVQAGFSDPEVAADHVLPLLVHVARYVNGLLRHPQGETRRRLFVTLTRRADRIRSVLSSLPLRAQVVLPSTISAAQEQLGHSMASRLDAALPFLRGLDHLLATFASGAEQLASEAGPRAGGRPPVSDALVMGVEEWHHLWRELHPASPDTTRKAGGFVATGVRMLQLALQANGPQGVALAKRSSLEALLAAQVADGTQEPSLRH